MHYKKSLWNKLSDESLLMIAQPACFPVSSDRFLKGECKRKYDAVNEYLQNSPSIKTVVLSGFWNYLMASGSEENDGGWVQVDPLTEEAGKSFKKNAISMISGLLKSKKRVIFIRDNPNIDFNIKNCFNSRPFRISSTLRKECSISSQDFRERVAAYDAVIDEILSDFPSVEVYDTRSFFCKDGRCNASDGQLPYYTDSNHLTTYGADKVVDDMLKKGYFDRH